MRRLAMMLALALPLAGTASGAAPIRPGAAASQFAAAAGRGDAAALWAGLTASSQRRYGPLARFRRTVAVELADGLGRTARARHSTLVDQTFPDGGAAFAIRGSGVWAGALRLEGERWKVDLTGDVTLTPIAPDRDARIAKVIQIAVGIRSKTPLDTEAVWLDGRFQQLRGGGTSTSLTLYGQPDRPLARGRHTVVAYARAGRASSATAWSFVIR